MFNGRIIYLWLFYCVFDGRSPCLMGESSIYGYFIVFFNGKSPCLMGESSIYGYFIVFFNGKIHHV